MESKELRVALIEALAATNGGFNSDQLEAIWPLIQSALKQQLEAVAGKLPEKPTWSVQETATTVAYKIGQASMIDQVQAILQDKRDSLQYDHSNQGIGAYIFSRRMR